VAASVQAGRKQAAPVEEDTNVGAAAIPDVQSSLIEDTMRTLTGAAVRAAQNFVLSQPSTNVPGLAYAYNNTYNLNVTSSSPSQGVVKDFEAMRVLG